MKKIFLSLVIFLSVSSMSFAQDRGGRLLKNKQSLPKELNLSEAQKSQVKTLNTDFRTKFEVLRSDSILSKDEKRAKSRDLMMQHHSAINNILTVEQQAQLKEILAKKSANIKVDKKSHRGNLVSRSVKNERKGNFKDSLARFNGLNLSTEQKEQIRELNKNFKEKSENVKKEHLIAINEALTVDQQAQLKVQKNKYSREYRKHGSRRIESGNRNRYGFKLDSISIVKLDVLKENYQKEKKSIEMSRVAPEEQSRRLDNLRIKYREERKQIRKDAVQKLKSVDKAV